MNIVAQKTPPKPLLLHLHAGTVEVVKGVPFREAVRRTGGDGATNWFIQRIFNDSRDVKALQEHGVRTVWAHVLVKPLKGESLRGQDVGLSLFFSA